jgi:hypothetical protein
LRPYFLRRLKGQVLQLPPKVRGRYIAQACSTQNT